MEVPHGDAVRCFHKSFQKAVTWDDSGFVDHAAGHLAALPGFLAVTLGGSRATGTHGPSSDWDFAVYPQVLRGSAPKVWMDRAHVTLGYARNAYVSSGRLTELAGALAISCAMAAHAVLAARGEWITNEKRLRTGLRDMDRLTTGLQSEPTALEETTDQAIQRFNKALAEARPWSGTAAVASHRTGTCYVDKPPASAGSSPTMTARTPSPAWAASTAGRELAWAGGHCGNACAKRSARL